jgi:hypothetical protein
MYRTEKWQDYFGVPLPASTQWEQIAQAAPAPQAVYEALKTQAAGGQVVHSDDTHMYIDELARQRAQAEAGDQPQNGRTGCFTTGIVARVDDHQLALFMSGANHAGENLAALLEQRAPQQPPPLHMCDGLSRNEPKEFARILCNCLTHARRNFVDLIPSFPQECDFVIQSLRQVYRFDAQAKEANFSAQQRLAFHQENSRPLMDALKSWMDEQFEQRKVEPNSELGRAFNYMLKRWPSLTRFLSVPAAPLDNNIAERALKMAILHRKNSLRFKTLNGALIGDAYMSLIHTCALNKVNPFDYLMSLIENVQAVEKDPHRWLPWNYRTSLDQLQPADTS